MTVCRFFLFGSLLYFWGANCFLRAEAMREAGAVMCAPGMRETVALNSTDRIPGAHGSVKMERGSSATAIDVELRGMKPALLFGGDYGTFVLWAVSPLGEAVNLGEFALIGSDSKLHTSTNLETFAVLVTAEPHFLATAPSAFVVLETEPGKQRPPVRYGVVQGIYNFERSSLEGVKHARGRVRTHVNQALTAVRLAQRAGADELAAPELTEAEYALDATLDALQEGKDRNEIEVLARETVRLAAAVQNLALERAIQNARVD
jgi:hypothetical protein